MRYMQYSGSRFRETLSETLLFSEMWRVRPCGTKSYGHAFLKECFMPFRAGKGMGNRRKFLLALPASPCYTGARFWRRSFTATDATAPPGVKEGGYPVQCGSTAG